MLKKEQKEKASLSQVVPVFKYTAESNKQKRKRRVQLLVFILR